MLYKLLKSDERTFSLFLKLAFIYIYIYIYILDKAVAATYQKATKDVENSINKKAIKHGN